MYFHVFFYIYFSIYGNGNGEGGILCTVWKNDENISTRDDCGKVALLYCKLKYIFIQCNLSIYTGVF